MNNYNFIVYACKNGRVISTVQVAAENRNEAKIMQANSFDRAGLIGYSFKAFPIEIGMYGKIYLRATK